MTRSISQTSGPFFDGNSEQGLTILEVVIATGLLGIVSVASGALLVAMGQATAGVKGMTNADILANNVQAALFSRNAFARMKFGDADISPPGRNYGGSADLVNCTNPNIAAAPSCNTAAGQPYEGPVGVTILDGDGNYLAGPPGSPERFTRGLANCTAVGASEECYLESIATFMPFCQAATNCARADVLVYQITIRTAAGVNPRGARPHSISINVPVRVKDVAEFVSISGSNTWVAPPQVTSVNLLLIGGGASGGYNDTNIADTAAPCGIAEGADNNRPTPDPSAGNNPAFSSFVYSVCPIAAGTEARQYGGGPGGGSGELLIVTQAVVAGSSYTVTVGAGGFGGAGTRNPGGHTFFRNGALTVNQVAEGGDFTGVCWEGTGNDTCNRGGNGSCTNVTGNCTFPGYGSGPFPLPAMNGLANLTLNAYTGSAVYPPAMAAQGGNPNGNNGGGAAGIAPFLTNDRCQTSEAARVAAGAGYCGTFAGGGGGGAVQGGTTGSGSGGYARVRW